MSLSLPLLESMLPAQTPLRQTAASPKIRLACIEMVHGAAGSSDAGASQNYWSPAQEGADFEFSYSLEPLAPFRKYITIVSGTDARQAEAFAPLEVGGDHFRSSAVFLTATRPKRTDGSDVGCGVSIDQLYARECGQETPIASLQLGIEYIEQANSCAYNYNCIYSDAISWSSPTTPLLPVINPRRVFDRLCGGRPQSGRSVLDEVMSNAARVASSIGHSDRNRLDQHLSDIRDIELRISAIERQNAGTDNRELIGAPLGVPDSWEEHVKLMFDLQALAFATDVTRVSSFKLSHDVSNRIFPGSGVTSPFHTLSHHDEQPARVAEFAKLNRYHVSLIPYFLNKLQCTPDGDGSLLDHSLVLYGSPMGDSQTHNHRRVPMFLAGSAGGQLKGNLHRVCPSGTPQANVLFTVLNKLGVPAESFGDSTGEVAL